ncbi:MAG: hypothetical protein RI932_746 [Pseudomonadota bacterium]
MKFSNIAKNVVQFSLTSMCILSYSPAWAQTPAGEYQPPKGEQPTYGKRYTAGQDDVSYVLELNAAQLLNKGIGLEFEMRSSETMNLGLDVLFTNQEVSVDSGASGETRSMLFAPKLRLYPMQTLSGVFLGGKVHLGQVTSSVTVGGKESEKSFTVIAPTVHIGYRFLATFGFTWSLYGGAGVNFPRPKFETKHLSEQTQASAATEVIDKINEINRDVRLDLGVTVGVAL